MRSVGFLFADLMKRGRKSRQLSLRELGRQSGFSIAYLSEIERGLKMPTRRTVETIAAELQIDGKEACEAALSDVRARAARAWCRAND